MTKLNQQILELIKQSDGHLSAEQAFLLAKNKGIDVSMASIYRILTKLAEENYINKFSVPGRADIFDKTTSCHGHLRCKVCGKIKDIHIDNFEETLRKQTGINNIENYNLCIDYICDDCLKNKNK